MNKVSSLVFLAFICLFYFALVDNARGPVYPEILRDFAIDPSSGSYFFAIASISGLVITMAATTWLKYIHLERSFTLAAFFLSMSALSLALASYFNNTYILFSSSVFIGVGMGFCSMSMNLVIEYEVPVELRRRAFSALHTTYGVASLISPLLYSGFLMFVQSWNYYFYFLAFLGLLFPLLTSLSSKSEPLFIKSKDEPVQNTHLPIYFLLILSLCVGTYVAAEIAVSSRLVFYLQQVHDYTLTQANNALSLFFFLLMAGRLTLALFPWKASSLVLMLTSLITTMALLFIGNTMYPLAVALTGLSMSIFFPSMMDWLGEKFPQDFTQVTSFALAGIGAHLTVMHIGFGRVVALLGLVKAMYIPLFLILASFIMLVIFNQLQLKLTRNSL